MFGRRVLLLLLITFLSIKVHAEVFTVTSNADSGPGTLREALTLAAANGSAEKDFINFNLPDVSEAGRTITLESELPFVSSNLSIDGSTQPGLIFGKSEAKVKIVPNRATYKVYVYSYVGTGALFLYNIQNVEIYGLFITNFADLINPYFNNNSYTSSAAIFCSNVTNATIGAPGKGNVMYNNNWGIEGEPITAWLDYHAGDHNSNIVVQSNFIMVDANGQTDDPNVLGYFYGVDVEGDNLKVGGDLAAERNYFGPCQGIVKAKGNNIQVLNNYGGIDKAGNLLFQMGRPFLTPMELAGSDILVKNNLVNNLTLNLNSVTNFKIFGNIDLATSVSTNSSIVLNYCDNGEIGSEDEIQKNVFKGHPLSTTIVQSYSTNISVLKNSIYCSTDAYIIDNDIKPPGIKVLINNDNEYSGTAPANSFVYIYEDNTGCSVCNPVSFYTKTQADASGNWKITGNFVNKRWVANALMLKTSTEFTQPKIINPDNTAVKKQPSCGLANGSIEIVQFSNILTFIWFDANDKKVGEGAKISGIGPGGYYVVGYNGNCSVRSPGLLYLTDQQLQISDANKQVTQPSCSQAGAITGLTGPDASGTTTVTWIEKKSGEIRSGYNITNLPPGEYTLTVAENTCKATYGPITISNATAPVIVESSYVTSPSNCSSATGAIKGIYATGGTGTLKYSWRNARDEEVSTSQDPTNQFAGKYRLRVTDDSNCDAVYSSEIEILANNDITIDISTRIVINATCDNGNGAIKNVTVSPNAPGLTYVWTNERNEVKGNLKDLSSVQAGTYTLTVSGGSLCTPVKSEQIVIESMNGVRLVTTGIKGKTDFCGQNTGEITGLDSPGATAFEWRKMPEDIFVSNKLDLVGVAGGNYRLFYRNATCSRYSDFKVLSGDETIYTGFIPTTTKSCFALRTGSITINTDAANEQPATYRWVNEAGKDVGFAKTVSGLPAGKYKLFLTNVYNCLYQYPEEFTVGEYAKLTVTPGKITNIRCGVGKGSISASVFTGGSSNYVYQWFDEGNNLLPGETSSAISNLAVGKYHLHLDDGTCNPGDLDFEVKDESVTPTVPEAKDIKVFGNGNGTIAVTDPFETAIYRLYETETSQDAIEARGGKFNITATKSRSYYITLTYGECESARKEVKVTRVESGIVNTITPNADGVNDYWDLSAISDYPAATVNIYTRYGQPIFQSVGYNTPFDGTRNGKELPAGVYYYVIDLKNRNLISGYITIIR